jgi:hypothetical protein
VVPIVAGVHIEPSVDYFSYDREPGEPYVLAPAAVAAGRAGLPFRAFAFDTWEEYRAPLSRSRFCAILSTHGSRKNSPNTGNEWEFGSSPSATDWLTATDGLKDLSFGAQILIVLACSAQQVAWERHLRPGSFAIVGRGTIRNGRCGEALAGFIPHIQELASGSITEPRLRSAWPNWTQFVLRSAP